MAFHRTLDPRAKPPLIIKKTYKAHQRQHLLESNTELSLQDENVRVVGLLERDTILQACLAIEEVPVPEPVMRELEQNIIDRSVYEHVDLPGLLIVPALLPARAQSTLLSRLLHRDLSNPEHLTNIHFHHKLPYPEDLKSFFTLSRNGPDIEPLDHTLHKAIPLESFLNKKLRWATLGGQYDWSAKQYPPAPSPVFPPDIAKLLETLFPAMKAEAAICNLYSPGDVLSMHRDVAEESDNGLISISIGCDAVFVIGLGSENYENKEADIKPPLVIRLRSGDAVFMGGSSRFAWHGVPRIVAGTCPESLIDWPAGPDGFPNDFEHWKGWMSNKRINLNVRQMWD